MVNSILELREDPFFGPESTVAVIYRTNAQSRYLEEACVSKKLPYVIRGGAGGFYKRAEVKDCLCFLRWLYNGNDESAMLRAFKTPARGLGDKAIQEFKDYCKAVDDFYRENLPERARPTKLDVLTSMVDEDGGYPSFLDQGAPQPTPDFISKRALNNFLPFATQMSKIRASAFTLTVDRLLLSIIETFKLNPHFDAISKSKAEFEERLENVVELRRATEKYSTEGPALVPKEEQQVTDDLVMGDSSPLASFLDDVSLVTEIEATDNESQESKFVVNLLTIHASKGTEYDAVFVVGLEEGTLPSSQSLQDEEDSVVLEEERRLCYVAMTRAKTRLTMTWRKEVTSFAKWNVKSSAKHRKSRSRFLDVIVGGSKNDSEQATKPLMVNGKSQDDVGTFRQRSTLTPPPPLVTKRSTNNDSTIRKAFSTAPGRRASNLPSTLQPKAPQRQTLQNRDMREKPTKPKTAPHSAQSTATVRSIEPSPMYKPRPSARPEPKTQFDSTLFYPVGSEVVHKNFGKGVVLQPPPPTNDGKLLVRVQFDNGRQMELSADGPDLLPFF